GSGAGLPRIDGRRVEGDVVVGREADQPCRTAMFGLPGIELAAPEADALPQRAAGARRAAALELDDRRRHLDDAGVEVDGAARGQVVRRAAAVHQLTADDVARAVEDVLWLEALAVEPELELG